MPNLYSQLEMKCVNPIICSSEALGRSDEDLETNSKSYINRPITSIYAHCNMFSMCTMIYTVCVM